VAGTQGKESYLARRSRGAGGFHPPRVGDDQTRAAQLASEQVAHQRGENVAAWPLGSRAGKARWPTMMPAAIGAL
jgi:hypothetical protein